MNQVWFTSDQHYGHATVIKFCNRPFKDIDDMREKLIANHNSVVKKGDRVYNIGDLFWRSLSDEEALQIRYRLNGEHYYIYGNHDEVFHRSQKVRESFIWCKDRFNLKVTGYPNIVLDHFAGRVWNGSHKGAYQLFGHSHNKLPADGSLSFDVGVDAQVFMPISIEEVDKKMKEIAKLEMELK